MNEVSKDILRMNGMKVNKYISKAIFTGPDRDIYRTHLYRTYFGQGLDYVQDRTQDITLWTNTFQTRTRTGHKRTRTGHKTVWS